MCFSCSDIPCEVTVPDIKYELVKIEKKLKSTLSAKASMESQPLLFDKEDLDQIDKLIAQLRSQLLEKSREYEQNPTQFIVASSFAHQVNERHKATKLIRLMIGTEVLSEYWESKQKRLALLCENMLKEATK